MSGRNLLVFNLATDANDPILAFTGDWLNALALHYVRIDVITMHAGRLDLPANVFVHSLGKKDGVSEALRLWRFYRILLACLRRRKYVGCFAHMQPLFAILGGPLLHLHSIRTILWYAHGSTPIRLRIAERLVQRIFTATPESCRLKSQKIRVVGHGIDTDQFKPAALVPLPYRPFTILSVSRLDPVKRLETLIAAAEILLERANFPWQIRFVGDASAQYREYAQRLQRDAEARLGENVHFLGSRPYSEMPAIYQNADLLWSASGTGSLDKVLLEAAACGLPTLSSNEAVQALFQPWAEHLLIPPDASATEMAQTFASRTLQIRERSARARRQLGAELRQFVIEHHNLQELARSIASGFSE